tara:strand:- start:6871 stop:8151 length:1281 start_codon:yes stop_codon:yes gene_type:complete
MKTIDSPIAAFRYAKDNLPYYQEILDNLSVNPNEVFDLSSFADSVPILTKEDIFPKYTADQLFPTEQLSTFTSAIVSSGTSGVFSYGLVTKEGSQVQAAMLDQMLQQFFGASEEARPVIINALPMGVSFTSSYPVIPVGTRVDIALHVIKTFGKEQQVVVITDPRLLRQLIESGEKQDINWPEYKFSAVMGGMWSSASLTNYLEDKLNRERDYSLPPQNQVLGTMGITEVGLNLFTATPDLTLLRAGIQANDEVRQSLFGAKVGTPLLGYQLNSNVYFEIINQDQFGVGELVVTHLDPDAAPFLVRYNTGDRVKLLDDRILDALQFSPAVPAPIYAVYGRSSEATGDITVNDIKEIYYRSPDILANATDNFFVSNEDEGVVVHYQLKDSVSSATETKESGVLFRPVPFTEFKNNMGQQLDYKWKHC